MKMHRLPTWREMHRDTSPEIERMQFEFYRSAPGWRKLHLVAQLHRMSRTLAMSGIRHRHPEATEEEIRRRFANIVFGVEFAERVRAHLPAHRSVMTQSIPNEVLQVVIEVLERLEAPYLVGGSLASIVHGEIRNTLDADLVVDLQPEHVGPFLEALRDQFYIEPRAVLEAMERRSSFNLIHLETMFKVDIFLPKDREWDRLQLQRRRPAQMAEDSEQTAWFASPEDIVLAKLEWLRLGGGVSERQWRDVLGVLKTQGDRMDEAYLRTWAAELNVTDLLEQALAEARKSDDR